MLNEQTLEKLTANFLAFLPSLAAALLLLFAFWLIAGGARRVVGRVCRFRNLDAVLSEFLQRTIGAVLLAFGTITALGTVGVDVTALVGGLGLTGFALGLALKDIISNAISGVLLLMYKPFQQHERISVTGLEGTVVEVNLRYTILQGEGERIFIPNANLFTNPLIVKKSVP